MADIQKGRNEAELESIRDLIKKEERSGKGQKGGGRGGGGDSDGEEEEERVDRTAKQKGKGEKEKVKGFWKKGQFYAPDRGQKASDYRDRAAERRKGLNPDYDDQVNRLVEMDAETSKYLGGDLKHTHLVKGLDYALLVKAREEMEKAEDEEALDGEEQQQQQHKQGSGALADGIQHVTVGEGGKGAASGLLPPRDAGPAVISKRGQRLLEVWQAVQARSKGGKNVSRKDFKLIGYEFDLAEEMVTDVPVILSRSTVEDGPEDGEEDENLCMHFMMAADLHKKVEKGLVRYRRHGNVRKHKKRPRAEGGGGSGGGGTDVIAAAPKKKPVKAMDIFADISLGAPNTQTKPRPAPSKPGSSEGGYFPKSQQQSLTSTGPSKAEITASIKAVVATSGAADMVGKKARTDGYSLSENTGYAMDYVDVDSDDEKRLAREEREERTSGKRKRTKKKGDAKDSDADTAS